MASSVTVSMMAVILGLVTSSSSQSCIVSDIPVKTDLNFPMLAGRWFELKWYSYRNEPVHLRFRDYEHHYIYNGQTGEMNVRGRGRRPSTEESCFYYTGSLTTTPYPGKLIYHRPGAKGNTKSTDYWIVDTDYSNYLLTYGCTKILANGTCDSEHIESWLWSRSPNLPNPLKGRVEDYMRTLLCLHPDDYLETPHGQPCEDKVNSGAQGRPSMGYLLIVAVVAVLALFSSVRA